MPSLRDHLSNLVSRVKDSIQIGKLATARSPQWPATRRRWLALHPTCAACGTKQSIEVHHKKPFHLFPALELDPSNFITLCECGPYECHLKTGHHGNWKNFNPGVVAEAASLLVSRQPKPPMKTSLNSKGYTFLPALIGGTIIAILGYFAIPRILADHKLKAAEQGVVAAGNAAVTADKKATESEVATGRALQRESTQAVAALGLLPESPQKTFIGARLDNVSWLSNQLFGTPTAADAAEWRRLALAAFAQNAADRATAAQQLSAQQATLTGTLATLADARKGKELADADAARSRTQLIEAQAKVDEANGFKVLVEEVATFLIGLWVLAWVLGKLAVTNPACAAASTMLHTLLAPGLTAAHRLATKALAVAKAEAEDLAQRTGTLIGRVRAELPAVAGKIRLIADDVMDAAHKDVIGPVADAVHADALVARSEAEQLLNPQPATPA